MTMFKPTLHLSRLVVTARGSLVYDELFHHGLNVIRGENSTGKSTLMDFIFYALGGNVYVWRDAAAKCDAVMAEVRLSGTTFTLKRYVEAQTQRPMLIFWGAMDGALQSKETDWEVYPFKRSGDKESFSQVIFRELGLPEARGEGASNITMHQVMRLMYSDQMSPVDDIFKYDPWDNQTIRESVSAFLCGAFDPNYYDYVIRQQKITKALADAEGRLSGIFRAYSHIEHGLNMAWVSAEEKALRQKKAEAAAKLADIREISFRDRSRRSDQPDAAAEVRKQLHEADKRLMDMESALSALSIEQQDAEAFLADLKESLKSLEASLEIRDALGEMHFDFCPACLGALAPAVPGHCKLCQAEIDADKAASQMARIKRDVAAQIRESETLAKERGEEALRLRTKIFELQQERAGLREQYDEISDSLAQPFDIEAEKLSKEIGYLERQLDELAQHIKVALTVEQLSAQKAELSAELSLVNDLINNAVRSQEIRRSEAYSKVTNIARSILRRDLPRERAFQTAHQVQFDFAKNKLSVDGSSVFAASSVVYLKNSFMLSLFSASTQDERFALPRFMLFDNVEDKGMEPERSMNFQMLIAEFTTSSPVDCQIIMTTSMVAPELNKPPYTVGDFYTHDNRCLRGITT